MDTMKYVTQAVSKDKTRGPLMHVYRDRTALVGCDGHRLHMVNGQPETEPHFIDGYNDRQFPDYVKVFPESLEKAVVIRFTKGDVDALKNIVKAMKNYVQDWRKEKRVIARLELRNNSLGIYVSEGNNKVELSFDYFDCLNDTEKPVRLAVNLQLLAEAIIPGEDCTIEHHGDLKPLVLKQTLDGHNALAAIMPFKLDD